MCLRIFHQVMLHLKFWKISNYMTDYYSQVDINVYPLNDAWWKTLNSILPLTINVNNRRTKVEYKRLFWNPIAFFISLIMSLIMPLIFAIPNGMPLEVCLLWWPVRWVVAYFIVTLFVNKISFKLAQKVFGFNVGF